MLKAEILKTKANELVFSKCIFSQLYLNKILKLKFFLQIAL